MKERNPVIVVILSLITFGLYYLYWFYDTNSQFKQELGDDSHPGLRTLLLLFPPFSLISMYKQANSSQKATGGHDWLLVFLAYLVFAPVGIFVVQKDINDALNQ